MATYNQILKTKTLKTTISSADILSETAVNILPQAPAGFINTIHQVSLKLSSYGGSVYQTAGSIYFKCYSAGDSNANDLMNEDPNLFGSVLSFNTERITTLAFTGGFLSQTISPSVSVPANFMMKSQGGPTSGNSDVDVYVFYSVTKLDINP